MTDSGKNRRTERLKAALRDNLRRRKAQGRGRTEDAAGTPDSDQEGEPAEKPHGDRPDSDKTGL